MSEAADLRRHLRAATRLLVVPPASGLADLAPALQRLRAALPHAAVILDPCVDDDTLVAAIDRLAAARVDLALVFTDEGDSAFEAGYLAYLAGIPVRAGFAGEFGGGVLAPAVPPPPPGTPGPARHLFLLRALGLAADVAAHAL